jgi:fatty acid desaturase
VSLFLGWPIFGAILLGNFFANMIRNMWASTIIFCGHFTEDVHTFSEEECENK